MSDIEQKITFRHRPRIGFEFDDQGGRTCSYTRREVRSIGDGDINAGISAIVIALSQYEGLLGESKPFADPANQLNRTR